MKTVYLIRHAKTAWVTPLAPDRERILDEEGIADAKKLANILAEKNIIPDIMLISPAKRTEHTAKILAEIMEYDEKKQIFNEAIYNASVEDLLEILFNLKKSTNTVFLIGHNPSISMLANYLSGSHVAGMQTAGICGFNIHTDDWHEIATAETELFFQYHH